MTSSTSSSSRRDREVALRQGPESVAPGLRDRVTQALFAAALLAGIFVLVRPDDFSIETRRTRRFRFAQKLDAAADSARLVVAGNSKTLYGFHASAIAGALQIETSANLSYDGLRISPDYLDEIDRRLVTADGVVLWGLDSSQLRPSGGYEGFSEAQRLHQRSRMSRGLAQGVAAARDRSRPVRLDLLFRKRDAPSISAAEAMSREWFSEDGTAHVPSLVQPTRFQLTPVVSVAELPAGNRGESLARLGVSAATVDLILEKISAWSGAGHRVICVRLPDAGAYSSDHWAGLEVFWREFQHDLRAAGACVIAPSLDGLTTWDGLHLDSQSGAILSARVAALVSSECSRTARQ